MSSSPYELPDSNLEWDGETPRSTVFGDSYFSLGKGLEETRHVFLAGNDLERRWRALPADQPGLFLIGETGFGTGLNFLAAWELWQRTAPPGWRLRFVSVERYPLSADELRRAARHWPELQPFAMQLAERYPPRIPGQHLLAFEGGGVSLQLLLGEAAVSLSELVMAPGKGIDAWFLDGFAPAKNPQMWREDVLAQVRRLSAGGTTFATFTAAGDVRRGLQSQGFVVEKARGFGSKRDMLRGSLPVDARPGGDDALALWARPPRPVTAKEVTVIGAGLAGATVARALANRGHQVTVLERRGEPAAETSGNPQAILYTKLSPKAGNLNRFTLHCLLFALRHYRDLLAQAPDIGALSGVLQLATDEENAALQAQVAEAFRAHSELVRLVDQTEAAALAGVEVNAGGLWFPEAGWFSPPRVCRALLDHPRISVRYESEVADLSYEGGHWQLAMGDGFRRHSPVVVIANALDAVRFEQCSWLPLRAIRGQISQLSETEFTGVPRCAVCHEGYIAPADNGVLTFGATFQPRNDNPELQPEDHRHNLANVQAALPGLLPDPIPSPGNCTGRVGFRCTTPDYLPLVGPVPVQSDFLRDYAALRKNAKTELLTPGSYYPGLYLSVAHGSRGLPSTPFGAELVASLVAGEPLPLPAELYEAVNPGRFLVRDLMRGKR